MHYMFNQLYQKAPLGVIALSLMFGTLIGIFYSYPWFAIIFLCLFSLGMILISSKNIDVYIFILMTFSTGWYLSSIKQVRLDQLQEYANSIHLQKIEYSGFIKGIKETEKGWRAKVLITHLETDSSKLNRDDVFLFVYGKSKNEESFQNRAIDFLENMNPEKNSIISMWKSLGFSIQNAFDSQALLQLQNEYCSKKRCIECQIGNKLIVSKDEYY